MNESLTRYVKLRVGHAPGIPPTSKETAIERSRHVWRHVRHTRVVMHVGIFNPRWQGKRSQHSQRIRNPQFYVSGKRPMHQYPCSLATHRSRRNPMFLSQDLPFAGTQVLCFSAGNTWDWWRRPIGWLIRQSSPYWCSNRPLRNTTS